MRFEYSNPAGLLVVSDGNNVKRYDPRLKVFRQVPAGRHAAVDFPGPQRPPRPRACASTASPAWTPAPSPSPPATPAAPTTAGHPVLRRQPAAPARMDHHRRPGPRTRTQLTSFEAATASPPACSSCAIPPVVRAATRACPVERPVLSGSRRSTFALWLTFLPGSGILRHRSAAAVLTVPDIIPSRGGVRETKLIAPGPQRRAFFSPSWTPAAPHALGEPHAPPHRHLERQLRPPARRTGRPLRRRTGARTSCACRRSSAARASSRGAAFEDMGLPHLKIARPEGLARRRHRLAACRSRTPRRWTSAAKATPAASRRHGRRASRSRTSTSRPAATSPTATLNPKFDHKLDFYETLTAELRRRDPKAPAGCSPATSTSRRARTTSGTTATCRRSSATRRVEVEALRGAAGVAAASPTCSRDAHPEAAEAGLLVELPRRRLPPVQPRPAAGPHPGPRRA